MILASVAAVAVPARCLADAAVIRLLSRSELQHVDALMTKLIMLRYRLNGDAQTVGPDGRDHIRQVEVDEGKAVQALLQYLKLTQLRLDAPREAQGALSDQLAQAMWQVASTVPSQIKAMNGELGGFVTADRATTDASAGRGTLQEIMVVLGPYLPSVQ